MHHRPSSTAMGRVEAGSGDWYASRAPVNPCRPPVRHPGPCHRSTGTDPHRITVLDGTQAIARRPGRPAADDGNRRRAPRAVRSSSGLPSGPMSRAPGAARPVHSECGQEASRHPASDRQGVWRRFRHGGPADPAVPPFRGAQQRRAGFRRRRFGGAIPPNDASRERSLRPLAAAHAVWQVGRLAEGRMRPWITSGPATGAPG